jgi:hypothetical protein
VQGGGKRKESVVSVLGELTASGRVQTKQGPQNSVLWFAF